jgi:hypothetical protein
VGKRCITVACAILITAASCGGSSSGGSFSGDGVRFDYTKDWRPVDLGGGGGRNLLWEHAFGPGQYYSYVNVQAYSSSAGIDSSDIGAHLSEISAFLQSMAQTGGQSLMGDVKLTKLGSVPAVQGDFGGSTGGAKVAITFRDGTEYRVLCQYVPDQKSEILGGCAEVMNSFEFTGS